MLVKIVHQQQIHLYRGQLNFFKFKKHCQNVFKALPKYYEYFYFDVDGDKITVNSQQDLDNIVEEQNKWGIKKLFIEETDCQFQVLNEEYKKQIQQELSKQIYCPLPSKISQIKTVNLVQQNIKRKQQEMIQRQAKIYLAEMESKVIGKIIKEDQLLIKNEVANFMKDQLEVKIIDNMMQQQQNIIHETVNQFMDQVLQNCAKKLSKKQMKLSKIQQIEVFKPINPFRSKNNKDDLSIYQLNKNQVLINKIVDDKLDKMLPNIIKKVVKIVQARLDINGCLKFEGKDKNRQMQEIVRSNLIKKSKKKYYEC